MISLFCFLIFSVFTAASFAMDYEASKKTICRTALKDIGYSDEQIKDLHTVKSQEVTDVIKHAIYFGDEFECIYIAKLKNGGQIIADYCKCKGKETKKCTRFIPHTTIPFELQNGYEWFTMIEDKYQKSLMHRLENSNIKNYGTHF
jgi:hypothetical protein